MKKFAIAIALVLLAVSGAFAQVSVAGKTLYYKYVYTVDTETGMRSNDLYYGKIYKPVEAEIYLTFTRNACYASDEKGISKDSQGFSAGDTPPQYQGEQNDMCVFMAYIQYNALSIVKKRVTLNFSKDYKRLNVILDASWSTGDTHDTSIPNRVFVFEQAEPPKPGQPNQTTPTAPTQLW